MRIQIHACLVAATLAFALAACEKRDEDEFAGTYVGDAIDSQNSSNRKEFTLTVGAAGTTIAGTYQIRAILLNTSGIVNGTLTGSELALVLTPSGDSDCPYRISGTWSGNRITGSYAAFNCFVRSDGTLSLEKR